MGSVEDEMELEDGEINDLEDGEIEDGEHDDGNGSANSHYKRQEDDSTEVQPSRPDEFHPEKFKRFPVRERPPTAWRQRSDFDDVDRERGWNRGRNVARGRSSAAFSRNRGRGQNFQTRSGMSALPRRHSLSPPGYIAYVDLKNRSPPPPGPPYSGYPSQRHRSPPPPPYKDCIDHPAQRHRSPSPRPFVERGERLPLRHHLSLRPFFGDSPSHPANNTPVNPRRTAKGETPKEKQREDDFELLLERHMLIQQQLESLEKQEKAALAAEHVIDETFVDIPLDDTISENDITNKFNAADNEDKLVFEDAAEKSLIINNSRNENIDELSKERDSIKTGDEETYSRTFSPFKIKPQYTSVPSLSERSKHDVDLRKTKGESTVNLSTTENNSSVTDSVYNQKSTVPQAVIVDPVLPIGSRLISVIGSESNNKRSKRRRRSRRRKKSVQEQLISRTDTVTVTNTCTVLVDPHAELENKLFDLALSSNFQGDPVLAHSEGPRSNINDIGDIQDRQKKRKEQLKKWQESHGKQQQNNNNNSRFAEGQKKKKRKNELRRRSLSKRESSGSRKVLDVDEYEFDDYLEMPMDVESDSADGPVLPLIEDASEKPPPPPLPHELDNQFTHMMAYQDPNTPMVFGTAPFPQAVDSGYGGYYNVDQEPYGMWRAAFDEGIVNTEEDEGMQARVNLQGASNDDDADDGDDDEDALRALLLKSMANKRAAKLAAEIKPSPNSSAPASPGINSPKPSSGKSSTSTANSSSRPYPVRKVMVVPPQHEPVVIQLGQDSDDSDDEDHHTTGTARGASSLGGGLFGGLELMIKEARKSADVSKGKGESPGVKEPGGKPPRLEPKTPEALEHMPDYKKAEYKRLKEKLAQYEKKKRQPLTAVNQGKESSDVSTAKNTLPPSLVKLAGHVKECETKLAKQRKMLDQDQVLLSTVNSNVTEKKVVLRTQEGKVKQLQQQLESAQRLVLRTRLLVNKLSEQGKSIKERVTKKLLVMSDAEEELLRAKSFVSASKRQPMAFLGVQSLDNGQTLMEAENKRSGATRSENKTGGWSGAGLVQKMSDALVQKLQRLTEVSKKEVQGDGSTKRNLQDAANVSGDELAVKKVKTESSSLLARTPSPRGTPNKSAATTPRKSVVAERIALEKARLKKIEHELAEKLKLYNTQMEQDMTSQQESPEPGTSAGMVAADQESVKGTETPLDTESDDNKQSGVTPTVSEDGRVSSMSVGSTKPVDSKEPIRATEDRGDSGPDRGFTVSEQQLEYVKKLQDEKERRHTASEMSPLELPVPVHESAAQCIWLTSSGPLKTLVSSDMPEPGNFPVEVDAAVNKTVPSNDAESASDEHSPFPLKNYHSVLLYFRSYRLSPYFRTQSNLSLSSTSYATKLDPRCPMCSYDLQGVCNDEDCAFQHSRDCEMSKEEILQDIAAYDTDTVKKNQSDGDFLHKRIVKLAQSFHNQYKEKMSVDEICLLLVNRVRRSRKVTGPYSIAGDPRVWRPSQGKRKAFEMEQETNVDRGKGIIFAKDESIIGAEKPNRNTSSKRSRLPQDGDESQEVRYFSETYSSIDSIEATLNESPQDVDLWIKLARLKLRQKSDKEEISEEVQERNLRQALSTLSRGLEANRNAEELWLYYLQLFTAQGTAEDVKELYEQALEFAPAYLIWWQYIEFQVSYDDRKDVCLRLLDHLVHNRQANVEVYSHHILESLLYVVQLELFTGRYKKALGGLQAALGRLKGARGNIKIPDLTSHLVPNDHCLLWIAYIHVFEFHRVPVQWYEPSCGKPSRMVSKEPFLFPWQPSKGSRTPDEKLLTLFHDALRACTNRKLPRGKSVSISMPLYKNLVALERAHDRLDSAKGICCRLLQNNSSNVELWQCRVALEQAQGCVEGVKKAYDEGLLKCRGHAALVYSATRFYLEKGESSKAMHLLVHCVCSKFTASPQSEGNESSLAEVSSSLEGPDPVLLYCKLLSQPLPYDYKCPPLMEGVSTESLKEQQVFLWLNYCLLLELSSDDSSSEHTKVEGAYETAVHSAMDKKSIHSLWLEYLFYKRSVVLRSNMDVDELKAMEDLVHRCLVSSPTSCLVPYTTTSHWQDYSFHNQVVSLYLSCLPQSWWSAAMHKFLKWFPSNTNLALQACAQELSQGNADDAKKIATAFLSNNPACISMWKIAVSIELQRNCIKQARKLYQQATDKLPFAATLWKDFLMFEIARGDGKHGVSGIVERCRQLGVDIDEFCRTLQGK